MMLDFPRFVIRYLRGVTLMLDLSTESVILKFKDFAAKIVAWLNNRELS